MRKLTNVSNAKYIDVVDSETNRLIASVNLENGNIIELNGYSVVVSDAEPNYSDRNGKIYLETKS